MRVKAGCNDSLALSQEKLMVLRDIYIIYMYYFTTTQGEEFDPPPHLAWSFRRLLGWGFIVNYHQGNSDLPPQAGSAATTPARHESAHPCLHAGHLHTASFTLLSEKQEATKRAGLTPSKSLNLGNPSRRSCEKGIWTVVDFCFFPTADGPPHSILSRHL